MSLTNLHNAMNKLGLALQEKGNNAAKMTLLLAARTAVAASFTSDTSLTGARITQARQLANDIQFAIDCANNVSNGSGCGVMDTKIRFTETIHSEAAAKESLLVPTAATSAIVITTSSPLAGGTAGAPYTATIAATGGAGAKTFAVTAGSIGSDLHLASNGAITGTPAEAVVLTFTVTATDEEGATVSKAFTITVTA